ncbi:MAG TPA: TonB-dependent receptor [Aridibacter sp.]|nr:TonB-dependent receptor [Aridibacter sp.]
MVADEFGVVRVARPSGESVRLTVAADGFAPRRISINAASPDVLSVVLQPESVAAVVSVSESSLAGTAEALERTPGSIQRIDAKELELSRVFNFSEALKKVPGVNVRNEEGFGLRPNISIRGSDPTRSRKVLLLEDGIPLSYAPYGDNSSYYHPPIERFESVEVLKGSGQIEYGPVTVAGVVNYLTPNPTDDDVFRLVLSGGNRNFFNGTARYSGTFGSTGVVASFTRKQGLGSRENLKSGVNDLNVKLVQQAGPKNVIVFRYSHFNEDSRLTYSGLTEEEFEANPRQNPFRNDELDFFREGFSASHTTLLGDRTSLTTNFYTSYFSRDWWRQSSNSNQRPNRVGSDPDCGGMEDLNTTCGNQGTPRDFRVVGIEPKFNTSTDFEGLRVHLSGGLRIHYENQFRRAFLGDLPTSRDGEITELNRRNSLAASGFVQGRFIFSRFSVTPGLRIERINYQRNNLLNGTSASTAITQYIPGIGAAYNIGSGTTVFGGVHRGFAPPSTSDILTNNGGVVDLESELSWSYEAGVRSSPFEGAAIEAVYFFNDYENQIVPSSVAGGVGSTRVNAGETRQSGLEVSGRIDSGRLFRTAYNVWVQTAYTFLAEAAYGGLRYSAVTGFEDLLITGNRLPYTPRHLATTSVGAEYGGFSGFLENVYVGGQFSDDLNTFEPIPNGQRGFIPAQSYLNATANYRFESLRSTFFVTVKNLLNDLYIVDRTRGIYPGSPRLVQFGWTWELAR